MWLQNNPPGCCHGSSLQPSALPLPPAPSPWCCGKGSSHFSICAQPDQNSSRAKTGNLNSAFLTESKHSAPALSWQPTSGCLAHTKCAWRWLLCSFPAWSSGWSYSHGSEWRQPSTPTKMVYLFQLQAGVSEVVQPSWILYMTSGPQTDCSNSQMSSVNKKKRHKQTRKNYHLMGVLPVTIYLSSSHVCSVSVGLKYSHYISKGF